MTIKRDSAKGQITDGSIRYVLIRPDVLMGVAKQLKQPSDDFIAALEESAFVHAQASFRTYRDDQRFGEEDFLASACNVAAELGWGSWSVTAGPDGVRMVHVDNSPFASGFGPAERPVCAPIAGVLRAVAVVGYGEDIVAEETQCAAQGAAHCCFRLGPSCAPAIAQN